METFFGSLLGLNSILWKSSQNINWKVLKQFHNIYETNFQFKNQKGNHKFQSQIIGKDALVADLTEYRFDENHAEKALIALLFEDIEDITFSIVSNLKDFLQKNPINLKKIKYFS